MLIHTALTWQLCDPLVHSSISKARKYIWSEFDSFKVFRVVWRRYKVCIYLTLQLACYKEDITWPREFNKRDILYLHKTLWLLWHINSPQYIGIVTTMFQTSFRRFPKILQKLSEGNTNVSDHSRRLKRKIIEKLFLSCQAVKAQLKSQKWYHKMISHMSG